MTAGTLTRRGLLTGATRREPKLATIGEGCLARAGVHCQSCGDRCPESAIRFRPRLGGPPLPDVGAGLCTGCGDCLAACPAEAVTLEAREASHE